MCSYIAPLAAADDRITIRWAESVLYGPGGAPSSDPRFTFTYDPRVHDRDDFWREEGAASYPQYPPTRPVEPYFGREPGFRMHICLILDCMNIFSSPFLHAFVRDADDLAFRFICHFTCRTRRKLCPANGDVRAGFISGSGVPRPLERREGYQVKEAESNYRCLQGDHSGQ